MSTLSEFIERLDKEEEDQLREINERLANQDKKHEELKKKLDFIKDEYLKRVDSIKKNLDMLASHKYTIEKALEQTENLSGLPIPQEQHGNVVDLVTKMVNFVNGMSTAIDTPNFTSADDIHKNVINIAESAANDVKTSQSEMSDIQDLLYKTKSLTEMLDNDSEEETVKLSSSLLN